MTRHSFIMYRQLTWTCLMFRMYIEQYSNDPSTYGKDAAEALGPIIQIALKLSQLQEFTGREKPTVIT